MTYSSKYLFMLLSMCILASCSQHTSPSILEPIITLSEATEISRTEATLIATVDRQGEAKLSFITLFYAAEGSAEQIKISGDPQSDKIPFHLTGLKPGQNYIAYIEGGTQTATLKSNTVTFKTQSNELPKLSSAIPLSTGPLGIIVEFNIIEDGGEALTMAGCEIITSGSSEKRRLYLPVSDLNTGTHQLNITGLTPETSYVIIPFAANSIGEAHGESLEYSTKSSIVLQQPGCLSMLFENGGFYDLESLTISGHMNGDDFHTLRILLGVPSTSEDNLSGIKVSDVDLTDAIIAEGGGSYDGSRFTETDKLTSGIFADCTRLRNIVLPSTAVCLDRNAFARCPALKTITISAGIEKLLPSSECPSLTEIRVSKANRNFTSIEGVLFNHDASEIVWFPCGKKGDYQLPATITSIRENAFAETSITKLIIPATVTSISRGAFVGSALTEIILPDNITNISEGMFQNCSDLKSVCLGTDTEFIGNFVFDGTAISSIYLKVDIPPYATKDAFINGMSTIFDECTLFVPVGKKKLYRNHNVWGNFTHIEEFQP
ncbi:MAG: leucine-rich repeat domain-containing protein [Muribaculaceae bacterium]|nr:leucine-rich repeat domain-containing protein [Muribaculaceae bacterium]